MPSLTELSIDSEAGREAFTYGLHSGRAGTVHVEQVLEYNQDPTYLRDLLIVRTDARSTEAGRGKPALKARDRAPAGDVAAQLYRLLDQTNYRKSVDQLLALLQVLNYNVDLIVRTKTA